MTHRMGEQLSVRDAMGEELSVRDAITLRCPFCRGKVTVGKEASTGNGMVLHTMPPCRLFVKLEPVAFVTAVNVELARRRGRGLA